MRAWALTAIERLELLEVPAPEIKHEDDVLVKVAAVGVCGSDVHYFRSGRIGDQEVEYPFIIGHECAGVVEGVGDSVSAVKRGDLIAIDPAVSCMSCDQCRAGRYNTCRNLLFLGCPGQAEGCLTEYIVMPERNCFPMGTHLSNDAAVIVEPLSIGIHAIKQCAPIEGAAIAILGVGPIGLSVLHAAKSGGVKTIYVTDKLDYRIDGALEAGAGWGGNPETNDVTEAILRRSPAGLDVVFECCGEQEALDQAVSLLKPGGTLSVVGIPAADRISFAIHEMRRKELFISNVRRQLDCIPAAIELLERKTVIVKKFVTHRFGFDKVPKAFELVSGYRDRVVKAVVEL